MPCRGSESGYVGLHCDESPEVWFSDVVRVPITGHVTIHDLDKRFVEICEAGSIVAASLVPDVPVAVGASVDDGVLVIRIAAADPAVGLPRLVVATVRGVRLGCAGVRFPSKTRVEMENNNAFWSRARAGHA